MEARISIITLGVNDLKTSFNFYREGLGLPIHEGSDEIAFFELKGTWLAWNPHFWIE
jgi:catechol 2,3-dioxygenase-like lactoylglutathione lyase family enzyme